MFTYQYSATGPGKAGTLVYSSFAAKGVTDVRAEGPSFVVFRTADVNATFLKRVAVVNPIVPKHVWQSVGDPLRFRDPAAPIGSGPYRIESASPSAPTWKVYGWDNPRIEELMALQLTQLDVAQRVTTTHALERIVAAEVPVLPLVTPNRMALFDKTVMDSWYYTVGGGPVYPYLLNKLIFGNKAGA